MDFFTDLNFLVLPYAFDYWGTTMWHYETKTEGESLESSILPIGYEATCLNLSSFFYRKDEILNQIGLMKDLDLKIRNLALENRHDLPENDVLIHPPAPKSFYPFNQKLYEVDEETRTDDFSILDFLSRIAHLTNLWDPMEWRKEGIPNYEYGIDFNKYGFGLWSLQRTV